MRNKVVSVEQMNTLNESFQKIVDIMIEIKEMSLTYSKGGTPISCNITLKHKYGAMPWSDDNAS